MHPGGLNHPVTIERKVQVGTKSLGDPNFVWQTFLDPVFTEIKVTRGREHFDQSTKQRYSEDIYLFRCHYEDIVGLDATMRVVDEDDRIFDIKSIRPDAEERQDCIIECTLHDAVIGQAALLGYVDEAIPDGVVGEVYAGFTVDAAGGTSPYAFAVSSGALPTGLSLHASTGAVSGTPTAAGTFAPVIRVTDDAGASHTLPAMSITIAAA